MKFNIYDLIVFLNLSMLFFSCADVRNKNICLNELSYAQFEVLDDSSAYNYIVNTFDNQCSIDSNLKDIFTIRCIGRDDLYFFKSYKMCVAQSPSNNELGYCKGYLAEHYFKTNRYHQAALSYGEVLSLIFQEPNGRDINSLTQDFANLDQEDQNLYLTCLYSRANSFFRKGDKEMSRNDLDVGLVLSRNVNPIFLDSFIAGFE